MYLWKYKCIFFLLLLLTDFKSNYIEQDAYNCVSGPIIYKNVTYLPITAQTRRVGEKLYWAMEMTLNGNSKPQEQMKRISNGKKIRLT